MLCQRTPEWGGRDAVHQAGDRLGAGGSRRVELGLKKRWCGSRVVAEQRSHGVY